VGHETVKIYYLTIRRNQDKWSVQREYIMTYMAVLSSSATSNMTVFVLVVFSFSNLNCLITSSCSVDHDE
jgi:hypothetical protein